MRAFPYSTRDIREALPSYLIWRSGLKGPHHSVAEAMLDSDMTLMGLARHYVQAGPDEFAPTVLARALMATDFGSDIVGAMRTVALSKFDALASGYSALLQPIFVPDFKPQRVPFMSISDFNLLPEFSEFKALKFESDVLDENAIETRGGSFLISRQALLNDDAAQITAMAFALGSSAAQDVAKRVAEVLEITTNCDDGAAFFNTTAANLYNTAAATSPIITVSTYSAAANLLWRQPTPAGAVVANGPRYLVVPPEAERDAHLTLMALLGPSPRAVEVVVLPHLTANTQWYLLADPKVSPTLGLVTLSSSRGLTIERVPTPDNRDGIAFKARNDYRVVRLSRLGALKAY